MPAADLASTPLRLQLFDLDTSMAAELERVLPEYSCTNSHRLPDDAEGCRIRLENRKPGDRKPENTENPERLKSSAKEYRLTAMV